MIARLRATLELASWFVPTLLEWLVVIVAWEFPVKAIIGLSALVLAVVVAVGVSEYDARHPPQKGQP